MAFKPFIVLALATVAIAAPKTRRQAAGEPVNCSYVFIPSTTVGSDVDLVGEFNFGMYQIIHSLYGNAV